jgi:hypothetical protein
MDHYATPSNNGNRLTPAEVEIVLRRAAELNAHRKGADTFAYSISPEVLVQVAAAAGISESDVRRALVELFSDRTVESDTLAWKLYLENVLRHKQGLKLRRKTEASSLWDGGDPSGTVRRALDFLGHHALLKARSLELRVEDVGYGRSGISLIADVSNQRGEQLSWGGILGATLALPLAIAGVYDWLYFLAVVPALVAPGLGFMIAYKKACAEVRQALDALLDAAEEEPTTEEPPEQLPERMPGQIQSLEPIPKFTAQQEDE